MEFEDLREKYADFYMPRFAVRVGDEEFRETDVVVSELEVDATIDGADYFAFTMGTVFDRARSEFGDVDWDLLAPGEAVAVSMGYGKRLEPVFVGRVGSVRPGFPEDGGPNVEVSGFGLLHDMTRGTKSRSWDETSDSAVAEEIAGEYDFGELDVEDTGIDHPKIIQDEQNDYRFLKRLADRNGFEVFAHLETFRFRAPKYDSDPALTLRYGESLSDFSPEFSGSDQVAAVEVRHYDPSANEEIVGTAEAGGDGVGEGTEVLRVPVRSKAEAERVAEGALGRIAEGLVQGNGEVVGLPEIRVGETLDLRGLGERFTNTYYVEGVTHRIGESGYRTSFEVTERAT